MVSLLIVFASAKKENIVTVRITEGESPVRKAKPQSSMTIMTAIPFSFLRSRFIGLKTYKRIIYIIPVWSPETAKIWIAPAAA